MCFRVLTRSAGWQPSRVASSMAVHDDPRLSEILRALVAKDEERRREGRDPSFLLLQVRGGGSGLKPGIALSVTEADVRDLTDLGYLREVSTTSSGVRLKFVVTSAGRAAGRGRPVAVALDHEGAPRASAVPAPSLDEVLAWLAALEDHTPAVLEAGSLLVNQALADFDEARLEGACRRLIELMAENLIGFVDPARNLPQRSSDERISLASEFRVTVAGRDRLTEQRRPKGMTVNQIVNATNAQVAAGDVINFVSFGQLLDVAQQQLDQLADLSQADREDAQGIIDKLRSASTQVAIGAAGGGGGAVVGAILMGLLHLHS